MTNRSPGSEKLSQCISHHYKSHTYENGTPQMSGFSLIFTVQCKK